MFSEEEIQLLERTENGEFYYHNSECGSPRANIIRSLENRRILMCTRGSDGIAYEFKFTLYGFRVWEEYQRIKWLNKNVKKASV